MGETVWSDCSQCIVGYKPKLGLREDAFNRLVQKVLFRAKVRFRESRHYSLSCGPGTLYCEYECKSTRFYLKRKETHFLVTVIRSCVLR